jgi:hypothetical protein
VTPICLGKFNQHSWDAWISYDRDVDPTGKTASMFRYFRLCTLTGCDARQEAEDLEVVGKSLLHKNHDGLDRQP